MAIPLSKDYHEAIVLVTALVPTGFLTSFLNKRYKRDMNFNSMSLLMAAGLVIGGGLSEFLKLALGTGGNWTIANMIISIITIWIVSLLLNYIYIVRGHSNR